MNILAIESSCDETSAAVLSNGKICSNVVATQLIHTQYGGVVPELASRAHQQHILPVVAKALNDAKIAKKDLDAIAFTKGPGLLGALLVGTSFAKSMALGLDIPLIEINHMQAHVLAHFIDDPKPSFPFLCLTVSGGHTQIVKVTSPLEMEIIGETKDDAVGEAFDKTAKMLGLPYPGGPLVDQYAESGNPLAFQFPIAKLPGYDYSFSGLKTSLLYFLQKQVKADPDFISNNMNDLCASMRYTIIRTLIANFERAAKDLGVQHIGIAGGVSANKLLRREFALLGEKNKWKTHIPAFEYCTDNAAMIAIAAHYEYLDGHFSSLSDTPFAR